MKNKKHNHDLTNCLKVFVFALMILMPFLIFIPNGFYYGFNETAVAQEKTEYENFRPTNDVNNVNDFIIGNYYEYTNNFTYSNTSANNMFMIKLYLFDDSLTNDYNPNFICNFYIAPNNNRPQLYYRTSNNTDAYIDIASRVFNFKLSSVETYANLLIDHIEQYTNPNFTIYSMSITDSMSYAWKSVWDNDLFSWTRTTAIYNGINTTTNAIGITANSYLADYLTYIILFTIIYVIIDIILGAFTILTHLFNKEPK